MMTLSPPEALCDQCEQPIGRRVRHESTDSILCSSRECQMAYCAIVAQRRAHSVRRHRALRSYAEPMLQRAVGVRG